MEAIAHEAALRGRQDFGTTIELKLRVSAAHAVPLPLAAQQYENERSLSEMAFLWRRADVPQRTVENRQPAGHFRSDIRPSAVPRRILLSVPRCLATPRPAPIIQRFLFAAILRG